MEDQTLCNVCGVKFKDFRSLRRHATKKHSAQLVEIAPLPDRKFKCGACDKQFRQKDSLTKHERLAHNIRYFRRIQPYDCGLCDDFKHFGKAEMLAHMTESHAIDVAPELRVFGSEEEFLRWKEEEERISNSRFVSIGGKHKSRKLRSQTLVCSKSFYYKSRSKVMRAANLQTSFKLNTLCPAEMKYTELDGTYTVQYVRNHGHEVESETGNFKKKRRRISATERLRDEKDKLKTDLCALIDGANRSHIQTIKKFMKMLKGELSGDPVQITPLHGETKVHLPGDWVKLEVDKSLPFIDNVYIVQNPL